MEVNYVITRREPHGEVVDTYVMAVAKSAVDAEEFILNMAEEHSYNTFCEIMNEDNAILETAINIAKKAEDYYITHTIIFPVPVIV